MPNPDAFDVLAAISEMAAKVRLSGWHINLAIEAGDKDRFTLSGERAPATPDGE